MHILHITPFFTPNVGGVETHLTDLMKVLSDTDKKISVITYQPLIGTKRAKKIEKLGNVTVYRVDWLRDLYYATQKNQLLHFFYLTPRLLFAVYKFVLFGGNKVDLIHAHGINASYIAWFVHLLSGTPYIVSFHVEFNLDDSFTAKSMLIPTKNAAKVLVLTERSKKQLVNKGLSKDSVSVYSYWVDQSVFKPILKVLARKKAGFSKNRFSVLYVGRFAEEKGVLNLVKVAKKLSKFDFYFAGAGDKEKELRSESLSNQNIHILGKIENKKLPIYYSAADVLVVPSFSQKPRPTFEEGVPRVIIEAISCGTPVIGTDSGGMKEVIESGKIGVVTDSDEESILKVISKLSFNNSLLMLCKTNCRKYAMKRFSEKESHVITDVYNEFKVKQRAEKLLATTADKALKRRACWMMENLDPKDDERILDAGCGDGFYLHLINSLTSNAHLTGMDIDKRALLSARKNLSSNKIKLVNSDLIKKTPFKNNEFDKILISEVMEHLKDDVTGLKELKRILRPGGLLIISVPSHEYPLLWDPPNWFLEKLFGKHIKMGYWAGIWNQHKRLYRPNQLENSIEKAGLKLKTIKSLTWWCLPFNHHIVNLGARILAKDNHLSFITSGANKFKEGEKRSFVTSIYYFTSGAVDYLNNIFPQKRGMSIVASVSK